MYRFTRPCFYLLAMISIASSLQAGELFVTNATGTASPFGSVAIAVQATATAQYFGPLDIDDKHWNIQADINASTKGSLNDWSRPDFWGNGNWGWGLYTGKVIQCGASCGAYTSLPSCDPNAEGVAVSWQSRGHAWIQKAASAEIAEPQFDFGSTTCNQPTGGTVHDDPPPPGGNNCGHESACSPIVINLDRQGFTFTAAGAGVDFDIDADGHAERMAWIDPASEDAFLVLDRNGNGVVDDGRELFGEVTPQPPSERPNGFAALESYDAPWAGGDGDGWISAGDGVFPAMRLWTDRNHDGVSDPEELSDLETAGVAAIALDTVFSRRQDRHGNELRYVSQVELVDGGRTQATDVFFLLD